MKRWAGLTELRHSLGRARAIAEELNMPHLATYISHTLGVIQNEITTLDKQREALLTPPQAKPRRTRTKVEDNSILEGEKTNVTTNQGETT
jgi:hypothetical protein